MINLALVPIVVVAMLVDPKVITGVNGWIKPFKFTVSAAVYAATFLWLLTLVQGRRRWVQAAANVTAFALMVEIVLIIMQVVRGTTSHFNIGTPFDAAVFTTMGVLITLVAVFNLMVGIWLVFQRMPDPVLAWSVRLGVLISFVGMLVGYIMTSGPTAAQLAAAQAGLPLTVVGAHSVGVADGGPGLPLLGWSTDRRRPAYRPLRRPARNADTAPARLCPYPCLGHPPLESPPAHAAGVAWRRRLSRRHGARHVAGTAWAVDCCA